MLWVIALPIKLPCERIFSVLLSRAIQIPALVPPLTRARPLKSMQINWQLPQTYEDILYHKRTAFKIIINRPHKRNAFRPTVELWATLSAMPAEDISIGVVLSTGAGPATHGKYAFCAGDQMQRSWLADDNGIPRLNAGSPTPDSPDAQSCDCVSSWLLRSAEVTSCTWFYDLTIAADNAILSNRSERGSFDGSVISPGLSAAKGAVLSFCCQYTAAQALERG